MPGTTIRIEDDFYRLADARWAKILTTCKTVPWDETKTWLQARARGEHPSTPAERQPKP